MNRTVAVALTLLLLVPPAIAAQHVHGASPYADLVVDSATTLPLDDVESLRGGEGMGLALVAELNHYPGPRHLLELADMVGLDDARRQQIESLREEMNRQAVAKGAEVLSAEARLSAAFRAGTATAEGVSALTVEIGRLRGELRGIHLAAHVASRALLTEEEVRAYDEHRGYATGR